MSYLSFLHGIVMTRRLQCTCRYILHVTRYKHGCTLHQRNTQILKCPQEVYSNTIYTETRNNNIEQKISVCKHIEIQNIYHTANNFRNPYIIFFRTITKFRNIISICTYFTTYTN